MRIALDAMGGDNGPAAAVGGALRFARAHPEHEVVLAGAEPVLAGHLPPSKERPPNLSLRHASEVVEMEEDAAASARRKRDSSVVVGLSLVKSREADAFVSAGHSGAVMAASLFTLGRIRGVERPAIAALLPALKKGRCLLLDAGANVECKPSWLAQWAVMGEVYQRVVLGRPRPRVGILSNGEEATKGTGLTREAHALLGAGDLAFHGFVEGKDIFSGDVDVVVTDGFTGNVVLKTAEGTALGVVGLIRQAIDRSPLPERLGALLLKPTLLGLRRVLDWAEYGGAPLLGVDGVAIVAHGRSDARAIENALSAALATAEHGLPRALGEGLERAGGWLPIRTGKKGKGATGPEVID